MSKLYLQVNQYTQFGRRSRALFREIMLTVCEGLVGEKEKYCPKCRHVVGFWQLDLGTLADAYTLWLLSPIQWQRGARSLSVRSLVPFAMQSPTARPLEKSSLGFQESKNGGLVDSGTSK